MLKIRLRRTGARKRPNYRVVVAQSTAPRDGQYIEIIGFYDPLTEPSTVRIDGDKARRWISQGAQPTDRVAKLLAREGIIEASAVHLSGPVADGAAGASAEAVPEAPAAEPTTAPDNATAAAETAAPEDEAAASEDEDAEAPAGATS